MKEGDDKSGKMMPKHSGGYDQALTFPLKDSTYLEYHFREVF